MKIILTNGESINNIKEIDFLNNNTGLEYYLFNSKTPARLELRFIESILHSDANGVYECVIKNMCKGDY